MVIISKKQLIDFIEKHEELTDPVLRWYLLAKESDWSNFSDMKKTFPAADAVGKDLYVFNIGGNKCRLIARIFFQVRTVYIRFIGTHAQYDKVKLSTL